jgi:hypothetical protein
MADNVQDPPSMDDLRRLDSPGATALAGLAARFDDLQTVLRCCELLVGWLGEQEHDEVVVEAVWTTALLSYGRCFSPGALSEDDLTGVGPRAEVLRWHSVLLRLRDHYADPAANPRERCSVGVSRDAAGAVAGIGITSARQPTVDDVTVRQAGAIAFALSHVVDERIAAQQRDVLAELADVPPAQIAALPVLVLTRPD